MLPGDGNLSPSQYSAVMIQPSTWMKERFQEHIQKDSFATLNNGSYQSFLAIEHQIKVSLLSQQSKFGTPIYLITR
jgi:hypothetical protein